jgi:hypothetical protein
MTIRKKTRMGKQEIDISGPAGNAYALMGEAVKLARPLGLDHNAIIEDMMSGDYEHLLEVFDQNFGSVVDLVR